MSFDSLPTEQRVYILLRKQNEREKQLFLFYIYYIITSRETLFKSVFHLKLQNNMPSWCYSLLNVKRKKSYNKKETVRLNCFSCKTKIDQARGQVFSIQESPIIKINTEMVVKLECYLRHNFWL